MNNNKCPKHNTNAKKEYQFGRNKDVIVTVFSGCNCATCEPLDSMAGDVELFDSYEKAAGRARMMKQQFALLY